jgi:MFS family permease
MMRRVEEFAVEAADAANRRTQRLWGRYSAIAMRHARAPDDRPAAADVRRARTGRAFGYYGGSVGMSTAIGPLLGGVIPRVFGTADGWRIWSM